MTIQTVQWNKPRPCSPSLYRLLSEMYDEDVPGLEAVVVSDRGAPENNVGVDQVRAVEQICGAGQSLHKQLLTFLFIE